MASCSRSCLIPAASTACAQWAGNGAPSPTTAGPGATGKHLGGQLGTNFTFQGDERYREWSLAATVVATGSQAPTRGTAFIRRDGKDTLGGGASDDSPAQIRAGSRWMTEPLKNTAGPTRKMPKMTSALPSKLSRVMAMAALSVTSSDIRRQTVVDSGGGHGSVAYSNAHLIQRLDHIPSCVQTRNTRLLVFVHKEFSARTSCT